MAPGNWIAGSATRAQVKRLVATDPLTVSGGGGRIEEHYSGILAKKGEFELSNLVLLSSGLLLRLLSNPL